MPSRKTWPKDDQPAVFEDLNKTVLASLRFAYSLRRKNSGKDIPVKGLDVPGDSSLPPASVLLTAESIKRRGSNALSEIIDFAIRLGIEQGRRVAMQSPEVQELQHKLQEARRILNK